MEQLVHIIIISNLPFNIYCSQNIIKYKSKIGYLQCINYYSKEVGHIILYTLPTQYSLSIIIYDYLYHNIVYL